MKVLKSMFTLVVIVGIVEAVPILEKRCITWIDGKREEVIPFGPYDHYKDYYPLPEGGGKIKLPEASSFNYGQPTPFTSGCKTEQRGTGFGLNTQPVNITAKCPLIGQNGCEPCYAISHDTLISAFPYSKTEPCEN